MNLRSKRTQRLFIVGIATGAVLFAGAFPRTGVASPARAVAPSLGTAASFAVLAGSTVTNTGATVVSGNLGVFPGSSVTGFPPGVVVNGTIHRTDAVAAQAQNDARAAYTYLQGQPCDFNLTGQDLGGKTLTAGTYCFSTSAQLTGTLTLDAQGNPGAVFLIQIGSTLTTASNSSIQLINGAQICNVYFQVGSSATIGTNTSFVGTILALTSISLNTGANLNGRALALNGAVSLDDNQVMVNQCAQQGTSTPVRPATSLPTVARPTAGPTNVPIQPATAPPGPATAIAATATAVAVATSTSIAVATSTSIAVATSTAMAVATSTAIAASTSTAVAATSTSIAAATPTAAAATSTAVSAATATPAAAATATPTARPGKSATPTTAATPVRVVSHGRPGPKPGSAPGPTPFPVPTMFPHTGAGGTTLSLSPGHAAPPAAVSPRGARMGSSSPRVTRVTALPRTGGAAGRTQASPSRRSHSLARSASPGC